MPSRWLPLGVAGCRFGWVDPDVAGLLLEPAGPFQLRDGRLSLAPDPGDPAGRSQRLEQAARRLLQVGAAREWRGEQLDVQAEDGTPVGTIERSACRALGIETRSIQLNAFRADGSLVAARRAAHKLSDPNRWDNLAGGMIAAGEQDHEALAREAYEEASLHTGGLALVRGSRFRVQRRVAEGLMVEIVQVFDVQLPDGFVPSNRDGEVAAFETLAIGRAVDAIERGEFTLQSSMAILDALRRGCRPAHPAGTGDTRPTPTACGGLP